MRKLLLAAMLATTPLLTACPPPVATPSDLAGSTVLDEKGAIAAELAYTAANRAAALAIRSGAVSEPATIARIGELDRRAYAAVQAVRAAYAAGNSASYAEAFARSQAAIQLLLGAF